MGHFEKAFVQYNRGWRVRNDPDIQNGMYKCKDAIVNILGDPERFSDIEFVEKVIKMLEEKYENEQKKKMKKRPRKQKIKDKKDPEKHLLGKMNDDVKFLENFINFQKTQTYQTEYTVSKMLCIFQTRNKFYLI